MRIAPGGGKNGPAIRMQDHRGVIAWQSLGGLLEKDGIELAWLERARQRAAHRSNGPSLFCLLLANAGQLFRGLCPLLFHDVQSRAIQCLHREPGNRADETSLANGKTMGLREAHAEHTNRPALHLQRQCNGGLQTALLDCSPDVGVARCPFLRRFDPNGNATAHRIGKHIRGINRNLVSHQRLVRWCTAGLGQPHEQAVPAEHTNRRNRGAKRLGRHPRHHHRHVLGRASHSQGSGNLLQSGKANLAGMSMARTRFRATRLTTRNKRRAFRHGRHNSSEIVRTWHTWFLRAVESLYLAARSLARRNVSSYGLLGPATGPAMVIKVPGDVA